MRSKAKRFLMMFGVVGVLLVAVQEVLGGRRPAAHARQRRGRCAAVRSQKHSTLGECRSVELKRPRGLGPRVT